MAQPTDLTLIESDQEFRDFRDALEKAYNDAAMARSDARAARDDAEQTAKDIAAVGGVDGAVQATGDLPSSTGDDSVFYVLDDTQYYQDTAGGSVAGGWEEVGPNTALDAAQIGHVVSMPRSADSKVFVTADYTTVEDAIQAAIDHADANGGGRVSISEQVTPIDETGFADVNGVGRHYAPSVPAAVEEGYVVVRAVGDETRVLDPRGYSSDSAAIQEANDYIMGQNEDGRILIPSTRPNGKQITIHSTVEIGAQKLGTSKSPEIDVIAESWLRKGSIISTINDGSPAFRFTRINHSTIKIGVRGESTTLNFTPVEVRDGFVFNDVSVMGRAHGGNTLEVNSGAFGNRFYVVSRPYSGDGHALQVNDTLSGSAPGNNQVHLNTDSGHNKIVEFNAGGCPIGFCKATWKEPLV
jgi:hypothetical protein